MLARTWRRAGLCHYGLARLRVLSLCCLLRFQLRVRSSNSCLASLPGRLLHVFPGRQVLQKPGSAACAESNKDWCIRCGGEWQPLALCPLVVRVIRDMVQEKTDVNSDQGFCVHSGFVRNTSGYFDARLNRLLHCLWQAYCARKRRPSCLDYVHTDVNLPPLARALHAEGCTQELPPAGRRASPLPLCVRCSRLTGEARELLQEILARHARASVRERLAWEAEDAFVPSASTHLPEDFVLPEPALLGMRDHVRLLLCVSASQNWCSFGAQDLKKLGHQQIRRVLRAKSLPFGGFVELGFRLPRALPPAASARADSAIEETLDSAVSQRCAGGASNQKRRHSPVEGTRELPSPLRSARRTGGQPTPPRLPSNSCEWFKPAKRLLLLRRDHLALHLQLTRQTSPLVAHRRGTVGLLLSLPPTRSVALRFVRLCFFIKDAVFLLVLCSGIFLRQRVTLSSLVTSSVCRWIVSATKTVPFCHSSSSGAGHLSALARSLSHSSCSARHPFSSGSLVLRISLAPRFLGDDFLCSAASLYPFGFSPRMPSCLRTDGLSVGHMCSTSRSVCFSLDLELHGADPRWWVLACSAPCFSRAWPFLPGVFCFLRDGLDLSPSERLARLVRQQQARCPSPPGTGGGPRLAPLGCRSPWVTNCSFLSRLQYVHDRLGVVKLLPELVYGDAGTHATSLKGLQVP
ncbi:hypothetical protein Efla_002878 [Eimeria flavescens]